MKVLIIEDEEGIIDFYKSILEDSFESPEIEIVETIEEVKSKILGDYDLLIVDCNLPDGNAYAEVGEKIFLGELDSNIKIFISGIPYAEMQFARGKAFPIIENCYFLCKPVLDRVLRDIFDKEF